MSWASNAAKTLTAEFPTPHWVSAPRPGIHIHTHIWCRPGLLQAPPRGTGLPDDSFYVQVHTPSAQAGLRVSPHFLDSGWGAQHVGRG